MSQCFELVAKNWFTHKCITYSPGTVRYILYFQQWKLQWIWAK